VEIECLPADIPPHISLDVTGLKLHDVVRVSDLPHEGKFKFITDEDATVAHVTVIKEEVAPEPDAVAAAAAPAEPEVVKKGKQETEEAGGEAAKTGGKK